MALSQRRAKLLARLATRRGRSRERLVLVEGARAVAEALDAGCEARFAVVSPRLGGSEAGRGVRASISAAVERGGGFDVEEVSDRELSALSDTEQPQGVLLVCAEPSADLASLSGDRFLVLDGVQDPGNAGTLVRGAVAFGLDGVVCLDGTVDPWGAKTVRASAGLAFRIPIVTVAAEAGLEWLRAEPLPVLVADAGGEPAGLHAGAERFALVVGNEGAGARGAVRAAADCLVAVPMRGPAESLNAGVAGSILMHVLTGGGALG